MLKFFINTYKDDDYDKTTNQTTYAYDCLQNNIWQNHQKIVEPGMFHMTTPYQLGLTDSTFGYVKVDLNSNKRQTINARNLRHNLLGNTIAQYGAVYRTWSGLLYFDTQAELAWLRQLNGQRLIYFIDSTSGTDSDPTQVYWSGKFNPAYFELDLSSGSVPFQFEEVDP